MNPPRGLKSHLLLSQSTADKSVHKISTLIPIKSEASKGPQTSPPFYLNQQQTAFLSLTLRHLRNTKFRTDPWISAHDHTQQTDLRLLFKTPVHKITSRHKKSFNPPDHARTTAHTQRSEHTRQRRATCYLSSEAFFL